MSSEKMPHPGHDKHLCYLNNLRFQESNTEEFKALIKDPKFYCTNCGRAAVNAKNLCKPATL